MTAYLEHANITVPNIDAAIEFLKVIEPHIEVRPGRREPIPEAGVLL